MPKATQRFELLVGSDAVRGLKEKRVPVFGLGGVGGSLAEALARAGVGTLDLPGGYELKIPVRKDYSGDAILSARPEQLFFDQTGIPGKITLSVFLGDFIQYEVELVTGQTVELNEYTKDVDQIRADGEEVRISMQPEKVSLYEKESKEVLSC